jgi:hypothetical protein
MLVRILVWNKLADSGGQHKHSAFFAKFVLRLLAEEEEEEEQEEEQEEEDSDRQKHGCGLLVSPDVTQYDFCFLQNKSELQRCSFQGSH